MFEPPFGRNNLRELVKAAAATQRKVLLKGAALNVVVLAVVVYLMDAAIWLPIVFGGLSLWFVHVLSLSVRGEGLRVLFGIIEREPERIVWLVTQARARSTTIWLRPDLSLKQNKWNWMFKLPHAQANALIAAWRIEVPETYVSAYDRARHKQWLSDPSAPRTWQRQRGPVTPPVLAS